MANLKFLAPEYNPNKNGEFQTYARASEEHKRVFAGFNDSYSRYIGSVLAWNVLICLPRILKAARFHAGLNCVIDTLYYSRHAFLDVGILLAILLCTLTYFFWGEYGLKANHSDFTEG